MKRRELIKGIGLVAGALSIQGSAMAAEPVASPKKKRILRIAHITDIHMRPELNAPDRFRQCMKEIKNHKIDFFLNGGDTIFAADYGNITRDRVEAQWAIWQELRTELSEYEMHSCLGNHDMWWAAPDKQDAMYGKPHVVKQLNIPNRYYSFQKQGWHFVILDSNNSNAGSLDPEQRTWLEADLAALPKGTPVLCLSHYPILGVSTIMEGGNHTDSRYITDLFYQHKDKKITCLSGHIHLLDAAEYNGVHYYCNGALSGFWWEEGDKQSAGKGYYRETPPGYAILDLYEDGRVENKYIEHRY
ncbi:metallophosphoesterase [Pedobacter ginsengisoli]|uniref:Metallophosphoesterase n=1 Tax=Pedobacter ginsengisoli TaxID=363852 RepID=A0A2D1U6H2_9SPHI|nr:metallophosphoesterase [Pedobacter ginsengisoli]ATP57187.1 metallophosphoesterase [Pedobacter ginsengisoli]